LVRPIAEYPLADFRRVLDVNVVGVFLGLKHVLPVIADAGGGAVINSSSVAGLTGTAGLCAYNASKHAVIGLTRSAAAEWGGRGIRVNSVNPGPIATRMMSSLEEGLSPGRAAKAREQFSAMIPALRYGTPEEGGTGRVPGVGGRPLYPRSRLRHRRRFYCELTMAGAADMFA
jgi:NAD(P)-dependent dehydrogenase (short-subunit alcohol dehydrogenase family)